MTYTEKDGRWMFGGYLCKTDKYGEYVAGWYSQNSLSRMGPDHNFGSANL